MWNESKPGFFPGLLSFCTKHFLACSHSAQNIVPIKLGKVISRFTKKFHHRGMAAHPAARWSVVMLRCGGMCEKIMYIYMFIFECVFFVQFLAARGKNFFKESLIGDMRY